MITTGDAIKVMYAIQRAHPRTAPRMDDREVTLAIATMWAELFNDHHLELRDLIAAVKRRAGTERDAPEPAEIITIAREIRRQRDAETGPTPEYEALCESKAEDHEELATNRKQRANAPQIERPEIKQLIAGIANRKSAEAPHA